MTAFSIASPSPRICTMTFHPCNAPGTNCGLAVRLNDAESALDGWRGGRQPPVRFETHIEVLPRRFAPGDVHARWAPVWALARLVAALLRAEKKKFGIRKSHSRALLTVWPPASTPAHLPPQPTLVCCFCPHCSYMPLNSDPRLLPERSCAFLKGGVTSAATEALPQLGAAISRGGSKPLPVSPGRLPSQLRL